MTIEYKDSKRIVATSADLAVVSNRGTVTTSGSDTIITFTGNGTFTPTSAFNVEYLVVGGGGSGAVNNGGGGAGGYRTATGFAVTVQNYTITVGEGGIGSGYTGDRGNNGSDSVFSTITSTGGGGGGCELSGQIIGGNGGSGGGGGHTSGSAGGISSPVTSPVQGYAGGSSGNTQVGGGGGGSSVVGSNGSGATAGNGGNGTANSITGSSVTYAAGGGGGDVSSGSTGGSGGIGGDGSGQNGTGTAGDTNTGSGGGGSTGGSGNSGNGGSGIVIIKFVTSGNTYDTSAGGKPTNVQDNSILIEKDTANRYWSSSTLTQSLEYTTAESWTKVGTLVTVDDTIAGKAGGTAIITNADHRVHKALSETLSDTAFIVDFEFAFNSVSGSNPRSHPIMLTAGTSEPQTASQDAIGIQTVNDNFRLIMKNGSTFTYGTYFNTVTGSTYYMRIKRLSSTQVELSVFTDSARTTHLSGSPSTETVSSSTVGLTHIQHASSNLSLTGTNNWAIDNTKIYNAVTSVDATWTMNPTWEDNFADFTVDTTVDNTEVKGWTPNDASEAWIDAGTNSLDFNQGNDSSNNAIVFDMQSSYGTGANISDTKWRLDFETIYDSFSGGQNQALHWFGFSSDDETVSRGTAQDGITIQFNPYASNWGISDADNTALPEDGTGMSLTYSTATTYYWSIWRDGDTVTATRWSDSTRSTASQTDTEDISAKTITGLRYIKWMNRTLTSIGTVVGRITNITMYNGAISPN